MERAALGGGPTLIEALTYRMGGHSTSDDPTRYRDKKVLEPWATRDPLERLRQYLETQRRWSQEQEESLRQQIDARVKEAVSAAESTAAPTLETMFEDVYATLPWHLKEQRDELVSGPRAPSHH